MFHVNEAGDTLPCRDRSGRCPYGAEAHHETFEEAQAFFESTQELSIASKSSKKFPHSMSLSSQVTEVLDSLYAAGFDPYVVGGSVRDSVLSGAEPKDIDIEVFGAGSSDELEAVLKKTGHRVDSVGKSFGVLKIALANGEDLDISMPRRDSKVGEGHRGFQVEVDGGLSLREAAGRRDFTINALYYSARDHIVKDPYGGLQDYHAGVLRHINEQFSEDPLRVIRGAQFAGRFSMELHRDTVRLSRELLPELRTLATERLQTEFEKLFGKGDVVFGVSALRATKWAENLGLGSISDKESQAANEAVARAAKLNEDKALFGVSKILSALTPKARGEFAKIALVGDRRQRKAINLAAASGPSSPASRDVKAWARALGKSGLTVKDFYIANGDERIRGVALKADSFESPIPDYLTGAMILEASEEKPGPWIGKLMREAAQAQDNEEFNSARSAEDWLRARLNNSQ